MSVSEVLGAVRKGKRGTELGSARVCSSKEGFSEALAEKVVLE